MNQDYYRYIYSIHQKQVESNNLQQKVSQSTQRNPNLRMRFLLYASDLLLGVGQRIRPEEFRVHVHGTQAHEPSLEIKAGGC